MLIHLGRILAFCIFGLSVFLAGLNEGYRIRLDEATKLTLFHGDSFGLLFQCYVGISIAMLVFLASTFAKGIVSKVGSFLALFLTVYAYWWIVRQKSRFWYDDWNSQVFTLAFPIDIIIVLLVFFLLILQFRPVDQSKTELLN